MSDELPEIVRLRGGGFAWRQRELPPLDQFRRELVELDRLVCERGARDRALAKLDRLIALPDALGMSENERDVSYDALRLRIARWRNYIRYRPVPSSARSSRAPVRPPDETRTPVDAAVLTPHLRRIE
jgi:hypothetical protein